MELDKDKVREIIARRVAKEFKSGDVITLGIGLPTEVANYIPEDVHVIFHSENGLIGVGKKATAECINYKVTNAGGIPIEVKKGAAFFDTQLSFTMIRGGHIQATVLGALQVDEEGNLSNWLVPGKFAPGMGGAMDLVVGAQKVIVAMEHSSKGEAKILKKCTLPFTAVKEVDMIITERCVIEVTSKGLLLKEVNPLFSIEDIKESITADFIVDKNLKSMDV